MKGCSNPGMSGLFLIVKSYSRFKSSGRYFIVDSQLSLFFIKYHILPGILSVLLQAWYDVDYLFTVDEHVFNPPPKVKSGVVRLTRNAVTELGCDPALFKTVVKTTFGQRRKTIRNSIKSLLPPGCPAPDNALMAMRPEQLSVAQFIELTNLLASMR